MESIKFPGFENIICYVICPHCKNSTAIIAHTTDENALSTFELDKKTKKHIVTNRGDIKFIPGTKCKICYRVLPYDILDNIHTPKKEIY